VCEFHRRRQNVKLRLPRKFFHLYLGEVCFRFNHRHEDLKPLLLKLLKTTRMNLVNPKPVRIR
jgi:transposase